MNTLPEIPVRWRAQYRQFELTEWYGWISVNHSDGSFESRISSPQSLFDDDNVIKRYKTERNHLAEVNWPYSSTGIPGSVILKSYQSRSAFNSLRLRMGLPRSIRHWNNAWILLEKGITTPVPIMLALRKSSNGQGFLAVETVTTHQRIRDIYPKNRTDETALSVGRHRIEADQFAAICGQYVREVHNQEVVHRDLSGGNILIPNQWDGTNQNLKEQFVMLDINRVRQIPLKNMSMNFRIQDLERMNIPDHCLREYYFGYAGEDVGLQKQWSKFLKYHKGYRRIRETRNPLVRGVLKTFTYWPRTG